MPHRTDAASEVDPHAETLVLPKDELAARREQRKSERGLTREQIDRLLEAAEQRDKTP